jgi:hypothetical protein
MPHISFPEYEGRVTLHKIKVNSKGFSSDGVHRGVGQSLYYVHGDVEGFNGEHFRAYNRTDAIFRAKTFFPNGKFVNVPQKSS